MRTILLLLVLLFVGNAYGQQNEPSYANPDYSKQYTANINNEINKSGSIMYVSVDGDDKNKGTKRKPFRTLEAARDAIRHLKNHKGLPKGGVHVVVMDGNYNFLNSPLVLNEQDSGTEEAPIVYRAENKGFVTFSAGKDIELSGFEVLEDKVLLDRLNEKARGKVISVDLSNEEVENFFGGDGQYGKVAMDGCLLQLAQYPNVGYNHIDNIIDAGPTRRWLKPGEKPMPYTKENPTGGKFVMKETNSLTAIQKEFERTGDMRAQGYFHNDWYFQDEPVGAIQDSIVQLLHHTRYGIVDHIRSMRRRVRLVNVLAELDQPGEWYYDKKDIRLYVWPIKGFNPNKSNVTIIRNTDISANSSFMQPDKQNIAMKASIISMENTSYVRICDFVFEHTGNVGVTINGGSNVLLAGNTFRNGTGKGISVDGGKNHGITACDFYDLYSAFSITGGDFKNLEWCHHYATNNIIRNCHMRGYGVVSLAGVGMYFGHNLLHTMNGAVMYKTVNMLMEYNEYYNIGYEMGDFNVAYCGAQWYTMNNVIRYNFVHHIIEPGGHQISAFRNDDNGAGMKIYGNVFYRPGTSSTIFHGFLNDFQNNITIGSKMMWFTHKKPIDAEGIQARWDGLSTFGRDLPKGDKGDYIYIMEQIIGKDGWKKGIWKETFPELEAAIDKNPWAQTLCTVNYNYVNNVKKHFYIHGGDGSVKGLESKKTGKFRDLPKEETFKLPEEIPLDAFVNVESLDFRFNEDFQTMKGFNPIPFEKIGLVQDQFRPNPPDKKKYRTEVFNQFKNEIGGRYNAEKVNARYPVPQYLK